MEADNIPQKPDMDEMDRKIVDQYDAGQQEFKTLRSAIQVQSDHVIVMPATTAHLSRKNCFHFLRLPPEVRNMVYQYRTTYVPELNRLTRIRNGLPNLQQPPITRVNRQIRQECLRIFYEMFHFSFDIRVRPVQVAGTERFLLSASENQATIRSFHEMIQAFAPSPENKLQMSNLRFLSSLTVKVTLEAHGVYHGCVGFHMTSADETNFASMAFRGLDWSDRSAVRSAWVAALRDSAEDCGGNLGETIECNQLGYPTHRALVEEDLGLLCLLAKHCPQLTRSVSLIYDGPGLYGLELHFLADDVIKHCC